MLYRFHSCVLIFITTILLAGACLGQERITSEVWQRYHRKALEICRATPYRIRTTIADRKSADSAWQFYSQFETEFVGVNSHHRGKYLETINIGKVAYKKQADGTWKKIEKTKSVGTVEVIERSPALYTRIDGAEEYTKTKADGHLVILQVESRYKMKYLRKDFVYDHHDIVRVWFDDLGRFVRQESFRFDPHRSNFIHRTEVFEYDENIYIEDPGAV